jgi:hypothetical protein
MSTTATTERPTIPRLPNERPERYQARVEYIVAGPDRSLEAVSQKLAKSVPLIKRWSSADDWTDHARKWDELMVHLRTEAQTQAEIDAYRRDLEDHRKRYGDAGKNLYKVAMGLMNAIALQLQGQTIEGKDGKKYTLPAMKIDQGAITILARAMTIAADLEAHALRLGEILPKLDHDVLDSQ